MSFEYFFLDRDIDVIWIIICMLAYAISYKALDVRESHKDWYVPCLIAGTGIIGLCISIVLYIFKLVAKE